MPWGNINIHSRGCTDSIKRGRWHCPPTIEVLHCEPSADNCAACERIFPSDQNGPGAKEAGVVIYIDRQLAGPYGRDRYRYTKGPFVESVPEHGYQGKDNPQTIYRNGLRQLREDFADLDAADQDNRLRMVEKTMFFRLLRTHTIEGMFSDPMHGGNAGLIGWQLIGYPGPVMSYRDEIDKFYGRAYRRAPMSLEQIVGHSVKGWEEEQDKDAINDRIPISCSPLRPGQHRGRIRTSNQEAERA